MEAFRVLSYDNVITLIQSLSLVYLIFNFENFSLLINKAILVNRSVLLEIIIPAPGLIKPIVEELIVEAKPINISVINISIFFLFKLLFFFFYLSLSILSDFKIFPRSCFLVLYFQSFISSSFLFFNNSDSLFRLGYVLI